MAIAIEIPYQYIPDWGLFSTLNPYIIPIVSRQISRKFTMIVPPELDPPLVKKGERWWTHGGDATVDVDGRNPASATNDCELWDTVNNGMMTG